MRKLTSFFQESDFNKSDKTDIEDLPVSSIRDDSDESQFISDSTSFGKTVTFAGTAQCGDGSVSPQREASESSKETMSVKELLKTFQTGHDPSKTKAGLYEHKVESTCISTLISESGDSEEIHTRKLTSFYPEIDFNKSDKTDIEERPVSSIRDDSDESQFISDSTSFGKTVTFAGTVQCGDGSVSPQREASESSKESMSVKDLLKTFQTGHDPSKTKAGLNEHKTVASSCISTLISESGDSEEIQTTEQRATQEPKSKTQTQNLTSFHQQSDAKKCYTADLEDQAISLSRDDSEESQFISDSASFGKTVTFADTVQCDDGSISSQREAPEKDTMSVKELMKAFQTVYDPSKTKAGLYEHKVESSCISTLISESGDSEEVHTIYQGATQEPKSQIQTQNVTSFHQQSDDKKCYTTDLEDRPVSLIRDDSEESQLISDSAYFGKMVTFADTVQCDDESIRPKREASEVPEKETTSVKELMKTFQTGQDPLKSKAGPGEHKVIASSCISTLISESVGPEEIQTNEHSPTQEPKSQFQVPHLTIFHPQSDVDTCGTLDLEAQAVSLKRDNSEELQLISDIAYFGKTVETDDTIQFDDRRVSPQREEPELSGKSRGRMQLEEPVISTGRSSSEDMQISPDRRPSEDFSADIKAELEESPEYQLFKRTAEDVSNHLEAHEEETLADSDTNPATISSPCIKSYFGKGASLTENQMKDDDLSPESPKHEGMAESSRLDIRTPRSSSGESENYEGLTVTHQMTNEMLTYSTRREETHIIHSQEERLHQASRDYTANDHGSKIFFTQTDTEVTEVEIKEPQLQEVHIEKNTSNQASTAVKDMSGMLSLLSGDLDQYLKARPVARQPPGENIVQERFDQIILKKDNDKEILAFVTDENKVKCANENMQTDVVGVTELSPSPVSETPFQEVCIERKTGHEPSTTERDMSGMLSLLSSDMDQYLEEKPVATQCHLEEDDLVHESYKEVILTRSNSEDKIDVEADEHMQTDVLGVNELSPSPVLETPFQEVRIERKTQQQQSATEKDMSGMLSLLSSDLDEYLDEKPVAIRCHPEEEDLVHESYKQVILTRSNSEDKIDVEANEHIQTDVVGVNELSPSPVSETPFQEVCIERKTGHEPSTTERDMSGMLSLLSSDMDQYLEEKPVATQCHLEEEDLVHESYKQVILTRSNSEDKIDVEANEHMQTDVVGDNELSPIHVLETPFQEVCIERKTQQQQQSATERDMSGMLSLLSSDLDEYLDEKPVAIPCHPEEEDLVHESYKEVILTRSHSEDKIDAEANEHMQTDVDGVNELSPSPVLETPFQEVCIERKTQQQQSATEKDMSGMLSLLSSDLDQYLEEKPVAIPCHPEEEDLVHESYKQVILTSSNLEDKIDVEANEHMQTDVVGVNELSPSPVLETPFQEVCIKRKTQQESAVERDMTGMLSLLSTDLNQYLKERPATIQCHLEENLVHESYKEVRLPKETLTISPEHDDEMMSPENKNLDFVDLNKKGAVESGWQTSFHEDERTKSFSSEEVEAKTSPCAASHFNDSTEGAVGITKSHVTMDDCNNDHKDANVVDAHSILKTHKSSSDTSQRPANLENLNTLVFGDPAKEPCHQDSLEASPLMEDGSSKKSPDSIEPSPTGESPSPDSLEGSPTQSKDTELKMPVKTAVYEDYASQLKACYSSDKNIYRDESEHDEQEDNYEIIQMQSEIKEDIHSYSADTVPDSMSSDTKICDSENLHILIRQDSLDADDSEDDAINKQFTPEEEMFKMAAKIKTFEEMEQDAKMKRDKSETGDFRDDEPDLRFGPVIQTLSQDASEENSEKYVTDKHHSDDDKEVESPLTDGSGSVMKPQAMACTKQPEYVILGCEGENDVALNAQLEAEEQINLCPAEDRKTPDKTPGGERTPDPFQFQEGKLFEMTRGGAIDMTRRSFDEGEGYAFFHIGEHPVDEVVPETGSANDTIPTPKPRTLMKTSSDKSESEKSLSEADLGSSVEVELGSPSDLERLTNVQSEVGNLESLGLGYLDSTIADLQSDTSTVAHSGQSHDSSDSSPDDDDDEEEDEEDPCSVIEMSFSAAQAGIPAYHQDSCRPLEITMKDTQKSELDRGKRKAEKSSTLNRRTRSEADSDTSKASNKDNRSYSDSSQPTDKSNFSPSKLPVMTQQKPPTPTISSSSPQRKEIQLFKTTETSVRSSLDADDISSASQKSPDSVIFTYDIAASHSSDSEGNPLPEVQSSSGREDVFVYRPAWDDTVETQMQRIVDEPTPECTPVDWQDDADRKEETLAIVADLLGFSWTELARELEFSEDDIQYVRAENPNSLQEQSHALLQRWVEREGKHATEDCLIKRLTKINRMDIVHLIETQMNKSVQEQTSRTYAEIEKTLDHSEVSVALSSVQEDAESPRVVRRVESDRRPPPAVSEEDLSVASLLDIPSWAEPAGHTHSESMHGDLLEDLEIPHELNPNLWTSEDVITQEPTSYDNLDEQVSTASSRTNLSESSKQNKIHLEESQVSPTETPSLAHDSNTLSTEKLELKLPGTFDLSKTLSEITLTNQSSSPQEEDEKLSIAKQSENSGLAKPSSVTPETLSQTAQESPDEQVIISLESNPTPPESGSPQLDQLLSDLEEMKLKFSPETLDLPLSEFSDESPEVDQIYDFDFEDLSPEDQCPKEESDNLRVSMSSATQLAEDTDHTNVAVIEPAHFQTSVQDEPKVVSVTPDLTKTSETSAKSSLGSCKDSPVSPFESLSTPESPQRSSLNSSVPVDIFQSSTYDENATETFSSVSFPQKSPSDILEEHLADLHESLSTPEFPQRSSLNSSFPVDIFQSSTNDKNATETFSSVSFPQKSPSDILEEHLANLHEEDSTTDILQSQEELESASSSKDSVGVTEEISTQSIQDQLSTLWEATFGEANQTEDVSPQSISDLTPETVTSARHFSFEELMPFPCPENLETSSDEDRPRTIGQHSEESLTPVDCLASQPCLVKPKAETTSSPSDEEYDIPTGYEEITSTTTVVHSGADSPTFEYLDPEPFFDCIQAGSDFSETEPDEPEASTKSIGDHPQDHLSHSRVLEMGNRGVLLSSGSEDYEDAPFVHEPLYNLQEENEELLHDSEASDEEFSLCEAPQPHPEIVAYDDTVKSLARADEMPDLPTESVTEERYKDENGHIVVKKVTRKVIRKCVSVDGVEREEVSSEGAPQGSISMAEGDGYSKVVKRTVLKSEGDHTEVTFAECEGLSASSQKTAEGCKVSRVERTTVVEGERTMTQQGDPSLASDLPSAQDDFKQALGYISGFSRTELPHVVERETFKEDGTVVRRAHMRKGRTHRRTVVKGAGQRKQVLLEQVDNPRKGSKPRDLQQHLHQLFHRSYDEEKKDNDVDEEEKEE
ncbi:ankyrin-2 isoform X2 [Sebastes umbrosus]|uniref:ankyrin-2 isoform X2 n=1 Tax=Sebastes umbrosus TaxID=72105 RepID=UPI0018A05E22|nr:ankyrin-2 isoform X2 [Sebastes umbrosus]